MTAHVGICAHCCTTTTMVDGGTFTVCCWNPTGCGCVPVLRAHLRAAAGRPDPDAPSRQVAG